VQTIQKRVVLSHTHVRGQTATPALTPPRLHCPDCELPLDYRHSYVGGVNARNSEQWDYYDCECGEFQYRHRTRSLRRV